MTIRATQAATTTIEAAKVLLAQLGLAPEQLVTEPVHHMQVPTFDEYIPVVEAAVGPGARRAYEPYWRRLHQQWGDRRINEPSPSEIRQLCEQVRANVVVRRNARGGRTAAEHMISALRCLYRYAIDDGYLTEAENPAIRVAKPRRLASTRRALADHELAAINEVVESTGNDPDLDCLLLRLHTETACRRGGALALRPLDLDEQQCLIRLHEKGETVRWQPVSPTLMRHLLLMRDERGTGDPTDQLLRYRNGRPITHRRYDHLWNRIGKHLPWVATQGISTHWLRHTTLTWVERHFGYAVARAYAGHTGRGDAGVTSTYVRADLYEVTQALAALSGEPHPLAPSAG